MANVCFSSTEYFLHVYEISGIPVQLLRNFQLYPQVVAALLPLHCGVEAVELE